PATMVHAVLPVHDDLLRLCGYYLAEGYLSRDTGRAGAVRERVGFCFHEQETEYIADVQRILRRYGLKFIERRGTSAPIRADFTCPPDRVADALASSYAQAARKESALTTIVSSRIFSWLLSDVLCCGTRSEDKI